MRSGHASPTPSGSTSWGGQRSRIEPPDRGGFSMAVVFLQEFAVDDRSTANYDHVSEQLGLTEAPDGLIVHTAGFDDASGVFRIVDVWESREQGERFMRERIEPIVNE